LLIFIKHLFNKLSSVAVILLTEGILRLLAWTSFYINFALPWYITV
jgi:hypothetical protein